tara:strand:- start:432 stop:653 length:222 start_codon:yes stop_codon:yes gene_type:complete
MINKQMMNSSLFLTAIYTSGHIVIAMTCNTLITGANLNLAALDALIEPCINGVWFYILHKLYKNYYLSRAINN